MPFKNLLAIGTHMDQFCDQRPIDKGRRRIWVHGAGITLTRLTIGVSGPLAFAWRSPGGWCFCRGFHQGLQ